MALVLLRIPFHDAEGCGVAHERHIMNRRLLPGRQNPNEATRLCAREKQTVILKEGLRHEKARLDGPNGLRGAGDRTRTGDNLLGRRCRVDCPVGALYPDFTPSCFLMCRTTARP
jgi:hypothetical protein